MSRNNKQRRKEEARQLQRRRKARAARAALGPQRIVVCEPPDGLIQDPQVERFSLEISSEPLGALHGPQVDEMASEGLEAAHNGDGVKAERLFRKCLELEPDAPDLLNNLAAAYALQGRGDESAALSWQIHQRWPDYFFGRVAMASLALNAGNDALAESYLAPLRRMRKMHVTQFTALATATIGLLAERGKVREAQRWLDVWRQVDPDHPDLPMVEDALLWAGSAEWSQALFGRRKC